MMQLQRRTSSDPFGPVSLMKSGAFAVVLSTASTSFFGGVGAPSATPSPMPSNTARDVSEPFTVQREYPVVKSGRSSTLVVNEKMFDGVSRPVDLDTGNWRRLVELPVEWASVIGELSEYSGLADGWKGPSSTAVSDATFEQSLVLAEQLAASLPKGPHPMVGADEDGNVVFSWSCNSLFGSLSVRGNGSYSFYMKRGETVCKAAKVPIFAEPPEALVAFLLA